MKTTLLDKCGVAYRAFTEKGKKTFMNTKQQTDPIMGFDEANGSFQQEIHRHVLADEKLILIPKDEIEPDPKNARRQDDPTMSEVSLDSLRISMENAGQRVPIIVGPRNSNNRYQLISGHRRLAAALKSDKLEILKAVYLDALPEDGERGVLTIQLIENAHRPEISPVSDAEAVKRLLDLHNGDRRLVQDALGIDRATLGNKIQLAEAPDAVKDFARGANVRDLQALYELIKLWNDDQPKAQEIIRERMKKGDFQGMRKELKDIRTAVKSTREGDATEAGKTGQPRVAGSRGRAPQATKAVVDWSKQSPILYIEAKGQTHRFSVNDELLTRLRETLQYKAETA